MPREFSGRSGLLIDSVVARVMRRAVKRGLLRREQFFPEGRGRDKPERCGDRRPRAARMVSAADHKSIRKVYYGATPLVDGDNSCVIAVAAGLLRGSG
jgi:hypothetical protein